MDGINNPPPAATPSRAEMIRRIDALLKSCSDSALADVLDVLEDAAPPAPTSAAAPAASSTAAGRAHALGEAHLKYLADNSAKSMPPIVDVRKDKIHAHQDALRKTGNHADDLAKSGVTQIGNMMTSTPSMSDTYPEQSGDMFLQMAKRYSGTVPVHPNVGPQRYFRVA